eukprot:CAMPEP_0171874534 /NCGR_PEP_ID=MMETSP0992-20121227/35029_1 /TAXON_ID=483369 /ORGANISM="non described non described, Strain CCMP2098" /LENGTH=168 /DNA_ID=CAMNT_0012499353 /DNA_START=234 /DNA_END=740 /DNA_ORIENTATION=+
MNTCHRQKSSLCEKIECLKRAVDVCYADAPSNEDDFFVASVFKGPTIRSVDIQPNFVKTPFIFGLDHQCVEATRKGFWALVLDVMGREIVFCGGADRKWMPLHFRKFGDIDKDMLCHAMKKRFQVSRRGFGANVAPGFRQIRDFQDVATSYKRGIADFDKRSCPSKTN